MSLLIAVCLVLTVCTVPIVAQQPQEVGLKNSLGRYYKFSYAAGEDRFAYELDSQATYKGNVFYPLWDYTDQVSGAEITYKTISDGATGGKDVLQIKARNAIYLTPLTTDGRPFEVLPGKQYMVRINAYLEVETACSQGAIVLGCGNKPIASWDEYYLNAGANRVKGTMGADTVEKIANANNPANKPVYVMGMTVNNGNNWASRVFGDTTITAFGINRTKALFVPDETTPGCEMKPVYDAENDSYSFYWPLYNNAACTTPSDVDKDSKQDIGVTNNYLTLFFSASTYTDEAGNEHPFTYDIESIEIWENGYTPGVSFMVDGKVVKSVEGDARAKMPYFVPETPADQVFTGWYTDAACTTPVDDRAELVPGVTKLYAGFDDRRISLDCTTAGQTNRDYKIICPSVYAGDPVNAYTGLSRRGGWSYQQYSTEGYAQFYATQPWPNKGAYIFADDEGKAFVLEPHTTYDITIEYKVNDLVTAEEVGTLPDGSTYPGGSVSLSVGVGMPLKNRLDLADNTFTKKTADKTFTQTTDWISETYTLTTNDLAGMLPVAGIYVSSKQLPKRYNADGTAINAEPADTQYGLNQLYLRRYQIVKQTKVALKDCFGHSLAETFVRAGETVDLNKLVAPGDYLFENHTGYTAASFDWYTDADCQTAVLTDTPTVSGDSVTYYAVPKMPVQWDENQVSYNGFEESGLVLGDYWKTKGYQSATALGGNRTASPINIAPSVTLKDHTTYLVTFMYQSTSGTTVIIGDTQKDLPVSDWTTVTVAAMAKDSAMPFSLCKGDITFDNVSVSTVLSDGGASVLTKAAQQEAGKQAMRFYYTYRSPDGTGLSAAGADYAIAERGVLLLSGTFDRDETLTLANAKAVCLKKTADFDTCWQASDGLVTYSNYVTDFAIEDERMLTVRGYVILTDGKICYSVPHAYSVKEHTLYTDLLNARTTYRLEDPDVLDKVKIEGSFDVLDEGITFDWTGSSLIFDATCMGQTVVAMHYNGETTFQSYALYIDGVLQEEYLAPESVNLDGRTVSALVFDVGKPGNHHVQISRRVEAAVGPSEMLSLTLNGELLKTNDNEKLIEFIGDSITCGVGDLAVNGQPYADNKSDGTQAYAFLTAMELNADWRIRSRGGSGFAYCCDGRRDNTTSWDLMYPLENPFRDTVRPYTQDRQADLVCIYLGTNDVAGYHYVGKPMAENVGQVMTDMKRLVSVIKSYNPSADIVWLAGGMTDDYIPYAKQVINELGGEENGYYYCQFPSHLNAGGSAHPNAAQQKLMQETLCAFITEKGLL